ncbi:hypothetical protein H217_4653 [Klebsiella pneumoniae DMC0799]|nr:hypothetical protein H217_4653 [Klebsiella pneumoniae DMC0799]
MATRSEYQDLMTARGKKMKPGTQLHKMRKAALCCLQSVPR